MINIRRLALTAIAVIGLVNTASATTVTWTGANDFNDATISFTGFYANRLTDITGDGYLTGFDWFGWRNVTGTLDIKVNGNWVNLWTGSTTNSNHQIVLGDPSESGGIGTPLSFTYGLVTELKLSSSPDSWNGNYQDVGAVWCGSAANTFVFDNYQPTPPVPDSGSTLVLIGLGLVGLVAIKRRK